MKRMIACVLADPPPSFFGTTNHRHNKTRIAVGKTRARVGYTGLRQVGMPSREYFTDRRSVAHLLYKPSPQTTNACALRIPSIGHQSVTHSDLSLELVGEAQAESLRRRQSDYCRGGNGSGLEGGGRVLGVKGGAMGDPVALSFARRYYEIRDHF